MDAEVLRARPKEIAKQLRGLKETAARKGWTVTQLLEHEDPTKDYDVQERQLGLDAFGRQLRERELRVNSSPEFGVMASNLEEFAKDDNTVVLFDEWLKRRMRMAQGGPAALARSRAEQQRAIYFSTDQPAGTTINPISFDPQVHFPQIAPAVPIAEVIAKTIPITGNTYEAYFLADSTSQKRFVRIPEGTTIPAVKLTGSNHVIKLQKFGRRLDTSYEALRIIPVDLLALHIQRMMVQTEVDKLAAIMDVAINGDQSGGNGATVYNLTTLDPGTTANNLTLQAYLTFKAKFRNPYTVTTMLANENVVVKTQLLSTGTANIPLAVLQANIANGNTAFGLGNMVPINSELGDSVRIGLTDDAPANKILAFDARFAIEQIVQQGSEITESERWITRQVETLVMTYTEGYAIIDQLAIKILDLTA